MIKVLHFVSTPSIGSGVMSVIMNYYRHIDRSKIQFDFLCFVPCESSEQSHEKEIEELGGRVFFIPKPQTLSALKELKNFLNTHGNEYVWLHNHEVYLSFFLYPLAKECGIRNFIVHSHATKFADRKVSAIRNKICCFPVRFMHCYRIACSQLAAESLFGKNAMAKGKVHIIQNAVDCDMYKFSSAERERVRRELVIPKDAIVIGHIGRFAPQKNHTFLLQVFKQFTMICPDSYLICIGDGPLAETIKDLAKDLKLDAHVIFLGQRQDVPKLLNMMDAFLLPSLYEGFPVALVEALSNGLPCLISDAITDEVKFPHLKYCSLAKSPSVWATQLNQLILQQQRSRANLPQFDINVQVKDLQEFYIKNI